MEAKVKYASNKKFKGSKPSDFYSEAYFLYAEGSNYGRKDKDGNLLFTPYDEQSYLPRNRQLASFIKNIYNPEKVLVLGCARGYLVKAFRELNVEAYGIDISEWAIQNAPPEISDHLYVGDICDLSLWTDEYFDAVIGLDVFEHVKTPDLFTAINETVRVTKKAIIIDVPIAKDDLTPDKSDGTDKSHVSVYTPEWWIKRFEENNFKTVRREVYTYPEGDQGATLFFQKQKRLETSVHQNVKVDIIIPNYNGLNFLQKCVESLYKNTDMAFNLIIVDNASTDGSKEYLAFLEQEKPNVKTVYLQEPSRGFADGNNIGLKHCTSPYVLLLNNDTIITQKDWLSKLVEVLESQPEIALVGCKLIYPNDTIQFAGTYLYPQFLLKKWDQPLVWGHTGRFQPKQLFSKIREVGGITFALALAKREIFGTLDGEYLVGTCEDADKCCELRSHGYKIYYAGNVEVYHYESATIDKRREEFNKQFLLNSQRFQSKWGEWLLNDYNENPQLYQIIDDKEVLGEEPKHPLSIQHRESKQDSDLEEYEKKVHFEALYRYNTVPFFRKKGLKWTYNFLHFAGLWCTSNPKLLDMLFRAEPYPDYIEVEITTKCPLKCLSCEHTYWNEPEKDMTFEQFKHIINEFPYLRYCGVTGLGDSTMNKDFFRMLEYCREKGIVTECYDSMFFTNKNAKKYIESGVYRLFISIDAATKETYEKVRSPAKWERLIENIKTLDRLKKELKSETPFIRFHYMIYSDNYSEVLTFIDFVKSLNIDVEAIQLSGLMHLYPEVKDKYVNIPDELILESIRKGKELGLNVVWDRYPPGYPRPCMAWFMPFIFVSGDVAPCCGSNQQNRRDFQKGAGSLGNIFKQSFKEIWSGEKYGGVRKFLSPKFDCVPMQCRDCFTVKLD
jgi:GT2 family glycosyltransferase/MoaA/NifB/PqqE/SkfB family radical SAM enzyme